MAEHRFDSHDSDFASETELLRGANALPTLSSRLRERVVTAAATAFRQARRYAQARQAASFLSICLLASLVLSPLANSSLTDSTWERLAQISAASNDLASQDDLASPQQPNSAWTLRHDRAFLDLPSNSSPRPSAVSPRTTHSQLAARSSPPSDKLLTALHHSDGWATVQAFQAVRTRSHTTLQRAFAAN